MVFKLTLTTHIEFYQIIIRYFRISREDLIMSLKNTLYSVFPWLFSNSARARIEEAKRPRPYFTKFSETVKVMDYLEERSLIDSNGHTVATLPYHDVMPLKNGRSIVCVMKYDESYDDAKYGFIDETGKLVIPTIYDDADDFYCGLAFVEKEGKCGFIDPLGKVIIPFKYEETYGFEEGLAAVQVDIELC